MAVGAFEDSRFDLAQDALERVVAADPYRERAWRLLMRIAAAGGDDDVVVTRYRRCAETLGGLGIEPSESTRSLLAGLRR